MNPGVLCACIVYCLSWSRKSCMKEPDGLSCICDVENYIFKKNFFLKNAILNEDGHLISTSWEKEKANHGAVSGEIHPFCWHWQVSSSRRKELHLINQTWQVLLHALWAQLLLVPHFSSPNWAMKFHFRIEITLAECATYVSSSSVREWDVE